MDEHEQTDWSQPPSVMTYVDWLLAKAQYEPIGDGEACTPCYTQNGELI